MIESSENKIEHDFLCYIVILPLQTRRKRRTGCSLRTETTTVIVCFAEDFDWNGPYTAKTKRIGSLQWTNN